MRRPVFGQVRQGRNTYRKPGGAGGSGVLAATPANPRAMFPLTKHRDSASEYLPDSVQRLSSQGSAPASPLSPAQKVLAARPAWVRAVFYALALFSIKAMRSSEA